MQKGNPEHADGPTKLGPVITNQEQQKETKPTE